MNFDCAELLGSSYRYTLWGEYLCPAIIETVTIQGRVTGDFSSESISGVWTKMNSLVSSSTGYSKIIANGITLGTGKVLSIDFDKSTDVFDRQYTANIEIYRLANSGAFDDDGLSVQPQLLTGKNKGYYRFFFTPTGKYIEDFSETYNFTNLGSGKYSHDRTVDFSINTGVSIYSVTPASYGRRLLEEIRTSYVDANSITAFYPDFYKNGSGNLSTVQNFDEINNKFSYSETFRFQTGLNYIWNYNTNISLSNGIITCSENGEVISAKESYYFDRIGEAEDGWAHISTGVYDRCSYVSSIYTGAFGYTGQCALSIMPEGDTVSRDYCLGIISYSRSFSNSPFNNSGYIYSYSNSISTDKDGYIQVSENGSIEANPRVGGLSFGEIYTIYLSKSSIISGRALELYNQNRTAIYDCNYSGTMGHVSTSKTIETYNNKISYNTIYSDNVLYTNQDFYEIKNSINDDKPLHIYKYAPVFNDKIYAIPSLQSTRGQYTNTISITSKNSHTTNYYISKATGLLLPPTGDDRLLKSFIWSLDPLLNSFEAKATYTYGLYRDYDEFLLDD